MWNFLKDMRPTEHDVLPLWYELVLSEHEGHGLTLEEAADDLGVSAASLRRWSRRLSKGGSILVCPIIDDSDRLSTDVGS